MLLARELTHAAARGVAFMSLIASTLCATVAQTAEVDHPIDAPDAVAQVGPPGPDQPWSDGAGPCFDPAVAQMRSTYDVIPELYAEWAPPKPKMHDQKPTAPRIPTLGQPILIDASSGPSIAAPNQLRHWDSVGPNGWMPPDPNVAAGPCHVMVVTNDDFAIYNKRGDELFRADYNDWFNDSDFLYDPVCMYDTHSDRFVFCVLRLDEVNKESYWIVCISDDDNPMGSWWYYYFNARYDGGNLTNNWADYPSIGFDADAVYVTANMFKFGGGFQYSKIRILDKSEIYNAQAAGWYDFWNFHDDAGTVSHTLRAVHMFSFPATAYIVNSNRVSGNYVVLWKISDPLGTPSVSGTKLSVNSYSYPPDADQPGTGVNIDNIDARLLNAAYTMNYLWTAHSVAYDWGAGTEAVIKYYRIYTPTPSVDIDFFWGLEGYDYYYPAICVNNSGEMAMCFARSGGSEYASTRYTGQQPPEGIQGSAQLVGGTGYFTGGRWGDFFGISLDGGDMDTFWIYGQYGKSGNTWGTYVGEVSFDRTADVTAPGSWSNFAPTKTTDQTPNVSVDVRDSDTGLLVSSAQYRYSKNGGSTWTGWASASCTGEDCTTATQTISKSSVAFSQDSMTQNKVQFRIGDMSGNTGTSSSYNVAIDSTGPSPWGSVSPAQTTDQTPDVSITIRDATSGLDVSTARYWYSRDGGEPWYGPFVASCTGSDGTTATQTVTAPSVPFNQDSLAQNVIWFYIEDMFGNWSETGWRIVQVDATSPGGWKNFTPAGTVDGGLQHCTVQVRDVTSGLDVSTAEYRYTRNGGGTWYGWYTCSCGGSDGTTSYQTISADVPFNHHDLSGNNQVQFRVKDMFGLTGASGLYVVYIDGVSYVRGIVKLGDYVGDPNGMPLVLTLYKGVTPIETRTPTLDSAGKYVVWFINTGGTSMWGKPIQHLSVTQAASLDGLSTNTINWTFPYNGDVDNDNAVTVKDLNEVLVHFGKSGPWADVDGSGIVDLPDLNFVLVNFGKVGS
jgi:hypothetical protein